MKKSLITLTVMLAVAAMVVVFCGPAAAKVTGVCSGCHTMHNSQGGSPEAKQLNDAGIPSYENDATANGTLLKTDCVGCHSYIGTDSTHSIGGCTVPVVYNTSLPSTYLSGGNFYWVADEGGNTDAKGHNVLGISGSDGKLDKAPGDSMGCGCHNSLAVAQTANPDLGSGCEGCHLKPSHHANDGTGTKYVGTAPDKWYRFLTLGHSFGVPSGDTGVEGIEHSGWGPSNGAVGGTDHNEYKGKTGEGEGGDADGTMTAFCSGCHGMFHNNQTMVSGSPWIRHPSDFTIPNSGEYVSIDTYGYSPLSPVARTDAVIAGYDGSPSGSITNTDMVMCLSCHRPHGSPYNDLLRWDYNDMVAGTDGTYANRGCFYCHSKKDAG